MNEESLLELVRKLPHEARAAVLERECPDAVLRARVAAILAAGDAQTCGPLDVPVRAMDETQAVVDPDATGGYVPADPNATGGYVPGSGTKSGENVGTIIAGRYVLGELVGEGGMGSVYLAEQTEPVKRQVALKLIKVGMSSRNVLARFDAERQALALMDHPSIARIYDGGITEHGQPFFVMELVRGVPLTDYCDTKRLSVDARLQLFVQVCNAVQHAHQKGIIHRDLKPGNILVTEVDGRPTPKVIDFGVAKATEQPLTDQFLGDDDAIVGTPAYMSPEQANPASIDIDTRTDVYALGVILYELLTGLQPIEVKQFKRGAILEMLRMVREVDPPRPSTKLSSVDSLPNIAANRNMEPARLTKLLRGDLDWLVMKALEKDRSRRYETANGLAADVQRYLSGEAVLAHPQSQGYRLKKFVKRNKGRVFAAGVVFLALVGGVVSTSIGMLRAEKARNAEAYQRGEAEKLAESNGKLADQNGELATAETRARLEKEAQLERTKAILFTSQMERVGSVLEKDPTAAMVLLNNTEACPRSLRDLAWAFAERSAARREYTTFPVPAGPFQTISPDGKWLAAVDGKRVPGRQTILKVTVYEVKTCAAKVTLPPFPDGVELLEFTPDGSKLAVVSDGMLRQMTPKGGRTTPGKVQLWDVASAKLLTKLEGHTDRITALSFSADGTRLVTASLDKTARLWDVTNRKLEHTFEGHTQEVTAVALRPDGKRLATGGLDNAIKLWDVDSRKLLDTWAPAPNTDPELASRRLLASKGGNPSQGPMFIFGQLKDVVTGLDFSADGTSLVSSNSNLQIEVRDAVTGQVRTTIRDLKQPIWWVKFHRDGKSVLGFQRLSQTAQRQVPGVYRWDVSTAQLELTLPVPVTTIAHATYCKEQGLLAVTAGSSCAIHDLDATPELASFATTKSTGQTVVPLFNRTGDLLVVGFGPLIHVWDVRTGALRYTLKGHINHVQGLAVSPDGKTLASCGLFPLRGERTKDDVHLWDLTTGQALRKLDLNAESIASIAFNKDGRLLAAVQIDAFELGNPKAVVSVWDVEGRKQLFSKDHPEIGFAGYAHDGASVAFNPVDDTLVSAAGHSLCIWDVATGLPRRAIRTGRSNIPDPSSLNEFVGMAISPDGKSIVTINQTGKFNATIFDLNQWSPATGELVKHIRNFGGRRLSFTTDGLSLVTAASNKLEVWDTITFQRRGSFPVHGTDAQAVATVAPDGQTLATAALPTTNFLRLGALSAAEVKLWDVSRSAAVLAFPSRDASEFSFSPDSKVLVDSDRLQGRTRFWELPSGRLLSTADTTQQTIDGVMSPDGRYMAAADVGGRAEDKFASKIRFEGTNLLKLTAILTLWDTKTNSSQRFEVGKGVIMSQQFTPDGKRIAIVLETSVGDEKVLNESFSILLWNMAESKVEATYSFKGSKTINDISFRPDGQMLAVPVAEASDPDDKLKVVIVDLQKGKVLPAIDLNADDPISRAVRFTPDGGRIVVRRGGETGGLTLWDVVTGKRVDEPIPPVFGPAKLSPNGRFELKALSSGVEVIDRTLKAPPVVSQRRRP